MEAGTSSDWLPPGYDGLLDSAVSVLSADERVRAMWVHGSVARGDADDVSDLDVILAVGDADLAAFAAGWRERLAAITPTVMARPTFGSSGSWLSITPEALRFDLWVEAASRVGRSPATGRRLVFDRDGLDDVVPPTPEPVPPSEAKLDDLRTWAGDCLALSVGTAIGGLTRIELTHTLRSILYTAMVETNRPLPVTGLKQWSVKLSPAQRLRFEALPTDEPAPVLAALEDVLGPLVPSPQRPEATRLLVIPEGYIRGIHLPSLPADERILPLTEEVLALHLYLAVVLHRSDWLLGVEGVHSLRRLLYELALELNGRSALTTVGDLDGRLTDVQRSELLQLPTGPATPEGVVAGHQLISAAFLAHGRSLLGDDYPSDLERAVESYVGRFLSGSGHRRRQ
ncbi:MAG TPA: nucleotidyltransferase domain-containing protein [Acidimicrobiales bacterium]|jgi:hypothetical protein|nr:nucleotidyltransferase domain-containing protein [Acidimicrobiales bacterium]